MVAPNMEK